jgi:hypothetical protein
MNKENQKEKEIIDLIEILLQYQERNPNIQNREL